MLTVNFLEFYLVTNERKHFPLYEKVLNGNFERVIGILGGGEQILLLLNLVKPLEITLLDLNPWQIENFKRKIEAILNSNSLGEFKERLISHKDELGEFWKHSSRRKLEYQKGITKILKSFTERTFLFWKCDLVFISNLPDWIRDQEKPKIIYEEKVEKLKDLVKRSKYVFGMRIFTILEIF